jgi:hypothetical protein
VTAQTAQTALRPSSGARYVLERVATESEGGEMVYTGCVHLPDADVPVEVRLALPGAGAGAQGEGAGPGARARVDAGAVPQGGPSPAEIERMAAALVKVAVRSAAAGDRPPPRKIVRWRG